MSFSLFSSFILPLSLSSSKFSVDNFDSSSPTTSSSRSFSLFPHPSLPSISLPHHYSALTSSCCCSSSWWIRHTNTTVFLLGCAVFCSSLANLFLHHTVLCREDSQYCHQVHIGKSIDIIIPLSPDFCSNFSRNPPLSCIPYSPLSSPIFRLLNFSLLFLYYFFS